tara:strand:+ start:36233 stop:37003 length:771 start_codon:yes stop_codon:yes gene_type:complete
LDSFYVELVKLYERNGFEVQSSLSPAHFPGFNLADIPFTYILKRGKRMCKGGGLSIVELMFLQCITSIVKPKNIFVIGNAFGWTTLALGLMSERSRVLAIDMCPRPEEELGIKITNDLGKQITAEIKAIKGKSPDDVPRVIRDNFEDGIDLVLIDGGHNSVQQSVDFDVCKKFANEQCIYVFHDVINFNMVDSFVEIAKSNPSLVSSLLFRTPSGMAISYPKALYENLNATVNAFTEKDDTVKKLHAQGKQKRKLI